MKVLGLGSLLLSLASFASFAGIAASLPDDEPAHPLAWLEGSWIGEGLGGIVEETWLPARGGSMLGVFRLTVNGKMSFCELVTISGEGEDMHMRLKHFRPDLSGWEEKDESLLWPMSDMEKSSVRFGPVLYEVESPGKLVAWVELGDEEGEPERLEFRRR